jgi:hypothetical protein
MMLSKGHEVVGLGYSRLSRDAARAADRGKSWVTLTGTAEVTGMDTQVGGQTGLIGTARLTKTMTQVGRQTGLLGTAGITGMTAQVSRQIELLGSAG